LLAEVGSGRDLPTTEIGGPRKVSQSETASLERYDFQQVSFFSIRELRKLRSRHEEFIRSLAARLSMYLRLEVAMQMSKLDTIPFQKFVEGMSNPTHLALLKLEPLHGICLLDTAPRLGLAIVDRELGGPGICNEDARELSHMEARLLSRVLETIVSEWCACWSDLLDLRPLLLGHENTGRFLQTCSPGSMMLVFGMETRIGQLVEQIHFGFPYQTLEPLMQKLHAGLEISQRPAVKPAAPVQWNQRLNDVTIPLAAQLPELQLTAKRLAQLRPGDVLPVPLATASQVRVCLGSVPKFVASLGTCDNRWALKILQVSPANPPKQA
jgi:flagellar motor switch protein FliM